jgi:hypothetical protein
MDFTSGAGHLRSVGPLVLDGSVQYMGHRSCITSLGAAPTLHGRGQYPIINHMEYIYDCIYDFSPINTTPLRALFAFRPF